MGSRKRRLDALVEKAYELGRPRALRIGPRQREFAIVPKSVRFNMHLLQLGIRQAFKSTGAMQGMSKQTLRIRNETCITS